MKQDNINYLLVGCFVLSMAILLMVFLFRITGRGASTEPYYTYYNDITGVYEGSKVTFGGYQIGRVDKIFPSKKQGEVLFGAEIAIKKGWEIPSDSIAKIIMPAMLSDKQINIEAGTSETLLSPGDTIKSQDSIDIMAALNDMAFDLKELTDSSIKPLIQSFETLVGTIGEDLNTNLPHITENVNQLLDSLNRSADQLASIFKKENKESFEEVFTNIEKITKNLADVSDDFSTAGQQVELVLKDVHSMVSQNNPDIRHSIIEFRNALDAVSQHINTIVYNLEGTSRNMNEFSREIRENPGLLLGGAAPKAKKELR